MGLAPIGSALSGLSRTGGAAAGTKPAFESALAASQTLRRQPVNPTPAKPPSAQRFRPPNDTGAGATVIPQANADPKQVASWWAGLSTDTRESLVRDHHAELGALRGLPAKDADRVNRLRLDEDVSTLRREYGDLDTMLRRHQTAGVPITREQIERRETLRTELSNAEKMKDQMNRLDQDFRENGGPQAYLLTYDHRNDGRFAVALGDPDTARNTAVMVPGTGHDVKHEGGPFPTVDEGRRVYDQMNLEDGDPTSRGSGPDDPDNNSVIVWLGADMPDDYGGAANPTYADEDHGGRLLHDDVGGYQAAIDQNGSGPHNMTVIAHSYGTYMTSKAVGLGMKVDDLVMMGSPGLGWSVDQASDLGGAEVWVAAAKGDTVALLGWYGPLLTSRDFGANVIATDDSEGHSQYLNEGTESLRNIAKVATAQDDSVVLRAPGS